MAQILYCCNLCDNKITKITFKKEDQNAGYLVCQAELINGYDEYGKPSYVTCGGVMERGPLTGPTTQVLEERDNGAMAKRAHHLAKDGKTLTEILKERNNKKE